MYQAGKSVGSLRRLLRRAERGAAADEARIGPPLRITQTARYGSLSSPPTLFPFRPRLPKDSPFCFARYLIALAGNRSLDFSTQSCLRSGRKSDAEVDGLYFGGRFPLRDCFDHHRSSHRHSSSASRFTAGASGFLKLSQSGERPETCFVLWRLVGLVYHDETVVKRNSKDHLFNLRKERRSSLPVFDCFPVDRVN